MLEYARMCLIKLGSEYGVRDNSIPYLGVWQIYRDTKPDQEKETS